MFCPNCGNRIADGAKFCGSCGAKLDQQPTRAQEPPKQEPPKQAPVQPQIVVQQPITEANLPAQYRPLSPWAYFGYSILFSIPVVGFILLIVFSCKKSNINRRNFARSYWCMLILCVIICIIACIIAALTVGFDRIWYQVQSAF